MKLYSVVSVVNGKEHRGFRYDGVRIGWYSEDKGYERHAVPVNELVEGHAEMHPDDRHIAQLSVGQLLSAFEAVALTTHLISLPEVVEVEVHCCPVPISDPGYPGPPPLGRHDGVVRLSDFPDGSHLAGHYRIYKDTPFPLKQANE